MDKGRFVDLLVEEQTPAGRTCDLGKALGKMDPDMRTEVQDALADTVISASSISRTLKRLNIDVSEGSVRRCRRICDCWKVSA